MINDFNGMLFRIEDINGFAPNLRVYDKSMYNTISIEKLEFDMKIAQMIRDEVNGSQNRSILSYSKSLATCLLKYNKYTDNELHVYMDDARFYNTVTYVDDLGDEKIKDYCIDNRLYSSIPFFDKAGQVQLHSFVIDVSDNNIVDQYCIKYTGTGRKKTASPEKDNEVVVLNPKYDFVIKNHMDGLYIIYALQKRYEFLSCTETAEELIRNILELDDSVFVDYPNERVTFINIIRYLQMCWQCEKKISERIYVYLEEKAHISVYYDPLMQYLGIQNDSFIETFDLVSNYNMDIIASLALRSCFNYLS